MTRTSTAMAILWGGIVAGLVDFCAAMLINLKGPVFIGHAVASGLFGRASFDGGAATALLGFLLHMSMALAIAMVFVLTGNIWRELRRRWLVAGLVYGVIVFVVMNFVVVPLSAIHRMPHVTAPWLVLNLAAMLLFGVIVAFFARAK